MGKEEGQGSVKQIQRHELDGKERGSSSDSAQKKDTFTTKKRILEIGKKTAARHMRPQNGP